MTSLLKYFLVLFCFMITLCNTLMAQHKKGTFIDVSVGFGLSAPFDDVDITGSGFYIQGEYVWAPKTWFSLRPYAGFISTSVNENTTAVNLRDFEVATTAFLLGGKARLAAPIPWVAPYIELGLGASIGSFETFTPFTNIDKNGFAYHVPFTLGLAVGRRNEVDVSFIYYFQPSVEQFIGAAAVGVSIPIK